jgi:hypothetical protein
MQRGMLEMIARISQVQGGSILEIMFQNTDAYAELGDMKQFSMKLHAILVSITEGDAFSIVDSARDCNGLESYRLLTKRYEPKNPGAKRALLKSIINNPGAKKITDIEANLMNVERLILKHESMTDEKNHLPEDLKATIIIELCHRDLREHLELSTDQMSYNKIRTEILNYMERKRDSMSNDIKAMEVDHLDSDYHYGDGDWWQDDDEYEQLNYFQKGGKGGKGGKGKGYYYSGKGGYEKGKGKGEGFEDRGGKGGYEKGEGKGEGFRGECKLVRHAGAHFLQAHEER